MEDAQNLLKLVKKDLETDLSLAVYNNIFKDLEKIYKVQEGNIYLIAPDTLTAYRLKSMYSTKMNGFLNKYTDRKMQFQFITEEEAKIESEKVISNNLTTVNPDEKLIGKRILRPEYTFDSFVTGLANRDAFLISTKVAGTPSNLANPFYIFGDVGLGKTHLMMAIGHYMLANNSNLNIVYTTAQQFVEDYFKSKNKNQRVTSLSDAFDNYYRSADVLLVDDVQYLADRQGSQDEFFKLFEYLTEQKKQIIITSDRKASELNIMDRLKSRFTWGIQVDIKKPDLELRKNILKYKLKTLISNPSDVPDEILDYIAANFEENVRELEGALRRFVNYCVAFNIDYTLEYAITSLESILPSTKVSQDNFNSNIELVKDCVASYFNIPVKELAGKSRTQAIAYARMIAIYLIRTKYNVSLKKIGESFGNRDHSTIAHAVDSIENDIKNNEYVKQDVDNIVDKLNK